MKSNLKKGGEKTVSFRAIGIAKLVRRSHNAGNCKHRGDCLTEKEMLRILTEELKRNEK